MWLGERYPHSRQQVSTFYAQIVKSLIRVFGQHRVVISPRAAPGPRYPRLPLPFCVTLFYRAFTCQPSARSMLDRYWPAARGACCPPFCPIVWSVSPSKSVQFFVFCLVVQSFTGLLTAFYPLSRMDEWLGVRFLCAGRDRFLLRRRFGRTSGAKRRSGPLRGFSSGLHRHPHAAARR